MKRMLFSLFAVLAAGGCCCGSRQAAVDPFYGRQTVPAPPTGTVGPAAPYYNQGVPAPGPAPLQTAPGFGPGALQPTPAPAGGSMPLSPGGSPAGTVPPGGAPAPYGSGPYGGGPNNWRDRAAGDWASASGNTPGDVVTIPGPARDGLPPTTSDAPTATLADRPTPAPAPPSGEPER